MSKKTIGTDELSTAIHRELTIYSQDIIDGIKQEAKRYSRQLLKDTKTTAPVGNRQHHYRDSIKVRKLFESDREIEYQWYVDGSDYRLSHLLERGHALRDGGRTDGTHFIEKASDPIIEEYLRVVEDLIKGGGY